MFKWQYRVLISVFVCRSAACLRRPAHEPATTREEDVAPESSERPEETPSSAVNVDIPEKTYAAESEEPTACPTTAPPVTEPRDPASPRTSTAVDPNEVPVGLIEDDLLSAELCNESVDSLRRVYKHFKVMFVQFALYIVCILYTSYFYFVFGRK